MNRRSFLQMLGIGGATLATAGACRTYRNYFTEPAIPPFKLTKVEDIVADATSLLGELPVGVYCSSDVLENLSEQWVFSGKPGESPVPFLLDFYPYRYDEDGRLVMTFSTTEYSGGSMTRVNPEWVVAPYEAVRVFGKTQWLVYWIDRRRRLVWMSDLGDPTNFTN